MMAFGTTIRWLTAQTNAAVRFIAVLVFVCTCVLGEKAPPCLWSHDDSAKSASNLDGKVPFRPGEKIIFEIKLDTAPSIEGDLYLHVGTCKEDPTPHTPGCNNDPDKEKWRATGWAKVEPAQNERGDSKGKVTVEVSLPDLDPIDRGMQGTWKVLRILLRPKGLPPVELQGEGCTTFNVARPQQQQTLPTRAAFQ